MSRLKASSTLSACPAAIRARPIVGRPSASSSEASSPLDLGVDRQLELAQPGDGPLERGRALIALGGQDGLERFVVGVHAEAEDVQLAFPQPQVAGHERVDLDTGQQRHPGWHRGLRDHGAVAGQGVVVGQAEDPDAGLPGGAARARPGP